MYSITSVTPTICSLMGIKAPIESNAPTIDVVVSYASKILRGGLAEKVLVYAPDAIEARFRS